MIWPTRLNKCSMAVLSGVDIKLDVLERHRRDSRGAKGVWSGEGVPPQKIFKALVSK
jgi:hypothetical protein